MSNSDKGRIYLFICSVFIITAVTVLFPALEQMLPEEYLSELSDRDVDPRALFYTESEQALDAYHLLKD